MGKSNIEWTEAVWNPVTGCNKVSQGCKNCYAERMHKRLMVLKPEKYSRPFLDGAFEDAESLGIPLKRKKPTVYFVNSMSDLFHDQVSFAFIDKVFAVMALTPQHTYQLLTKRTARMLEYFTVKEDENEWDLTDRWNDAAIDLLTEINYDWHGEFENRILQNVWLGTSVEDQKAADERVPLLLQVPAKVRWLSCEPLLGPVDLNKYYLTTIPGKETNRYPFRGLSEEEKTKWTHLLDWVVAGGESGPGARPMHPDWARGLRDQCKAAGVAFFFKQWGEFASGYVKMGSGEMTFRQFTDFQHWVNKADTWVRDGICLNTDGKELHIGKDFMESRDNNKFPVTIMHKMGKKKAGNKLDGVEHREYPRTTPAPKGVANTPVNTVEA